VRQALTDAGIESAEREAQWLIEAGTGRVWTDLIASGMPIVPAQEQRTLDLCRRRTLGEPLQYVTGVAGFRHLDVVVGPGVFIPRPETEQLVDRALARLPRDGLAVDIGTGSGAIAIAIAQERPDADVWATEISPEALSWAKRNVSALSSTAHLVPGDLFEGLPSSLGRRFDLVVSNPPYVASAEAGDLPQEVKDHEPRIALFADDDGLDLVRRIASGARDWLREGGWVVLEIGATQKDRAAALIEGLGYAEVSGHRDLGGRQRIVEARR